MFLFKTGIAGQYEEAIEEYKQIQEISQQAVSKLF